MLWWIFWTIVHILVLHRLGLTWHFSVIDAAVSNLLLGSLAFSALLLFKYYQPGAQLRVYRFLYALLIAIIYCYLLEKALNYFIDGDDEYQSFLEQSMPLRFIIGLLILSFIVILNWMYALLKQQKVEEKKRNEAEQAVKDAELFRLRQQLQPHFLFNSLNSISALAGSEPVRARQMIQQLSDFLRGTVKQEKEELVPFQEELRHLSLYLDIEKVRFGNRLQIQTQITPETDRAVIPPLLLQPLAENAIKFAVYGMLEEVTITLHARMNQNFLEIIIENPYDKDSQLLSKGTGFGLSSLRRRLLLLFSRTDLLSTETDDKLFKCRLQIPQ